MTGWLIWICKFTMFLILLSYLYCILLGYMINVHETNMIACLLSKIFKINLECFFKYWYKYIAWNIIRSLYPDIDINLKVTITMIYVLWLMMTLSLLFLAKPIRCTTANTIFTSKLPWDICDLVLSSDIIWHEMIKEFFCSISSWHKIDYHCTKINWKREH